MYAGEQFDPDLGFYYNRARYFNTGTGRFWTQDLYESSNLPDPKFLHKYLYAQSDPVNKIDPSGYEGELINTLTAIGLQISLLLASPIGAAIVGGLLAGAGGTVIVGSVYLAHEQYVTDQAPTIVTLDSEFKRILRNDFIAAARGHSYEAGTLASGTYGNVITTLSFGQLGDGCVAWQEWMQNIWWPSVRNNIYDGRPWSTLVQFDVVHYKETIPIIGTKSGKFLHNLAELTYTGSSTSVRNQILDPWRNPEDPVWDKDSYERTFDELIEPGAYGLGDAFIDQFSRFTN